MINNFLRSMPKFFCIKYFIILLNICDKEIKFYNKTECKLIFSWRDELYYYFCSKNKLK